MDSDAAAPAERDQHTNQRADAHHSGEFAIGFTLGPGCHVNRLTFYYPDSSVVIRWPPPPQPADDARADSGPADAGTGSDGDAAG